MNNDEVKILVLFADFLCISLCDSLLVKRVELADSRKERASRISCDLHHLVNNDGIYYV